MEVNILDYAIKGVLSIKYEYEWWRLVTYFSKSLNKIEKNYEIHNKEIGKLKIFVRGCKVQVQGLNWSQELRIFHEIE